MSELFDKMPTGMMDDAIEIHNLRAEVSRLTAERDALKADRDSWRQQASDRVDDALKAYAELGALRETLTAARVFIVDARPDGGGIITIGYDAMVNEIDAALKDAP
jgi:outer membrane murein-binding lipoprotein Lpp